MSTAPPLCISLTTQKPSDDGVALSTLMPTPACTRSEQKRVGKKKYGGECSAVCLGINAHVSSDHEKLGICTIETSNNYRMLEQLASRAQHSVQAPSPQIILDLHACLCWQWPLVPSGPRNDGDWTKRTSYSYTYLETDCFSQSYQVSYKWWSFPPDSNGRLGSAPTSVSQSRTNVNPFTSSTIMRLNERRHSINEQIYSSMRTHTWEYVDIYTHVLIN